jgi:hypothetical protein
LFRFVWAMSARDQIFLLYLIDSPLRV